METISFSDYSCKSLDELIALCKEKGINGCNTKKKEELVVLLSAAPTKEDASAVGLCEDTCHTCNYCKEPSIGFEEIEGYYYCETYRKYHQCPTCDFVNLCWCCKGNENSKPNSCSACPNGYRRPKKCGMPCTLPFS